MPLVGSSRISTFGLRASQRASTTFCWLPPESVETRVFEDGVLTASALISRVGDLLLAARSTGSPSS